MAPFIRAQGNSCDGLYIAIETEESEGGEKLAIEQIELAAYLKVLRGLRPELLVVHIQ